ncbi:MAG: hypothetical protein ACN4GM_04935 [Gammaproteobacteria bacterium]
MSHQNTWEENGLYRKFSDKISGEEILTSNLAIHGDARFDDIRYVINDFTQVVKFEAAEIDILKIATIDNVGAISNSYLKIAIVATSESVLDWIHQYCKQMQDSPLECKIFESVNDAYGWVSKSLSSA